MKKFIIVGVFLLLPSLAFASFDKNLKIGMSSIDVENLQAILTTEGCFSHASTGYFGAMTFNAVKCFQAKKNIPVTGYVGIVTRGVLNETLKGETPSIGKTKIICPAGYSCAPANSVPVVSPAVIVTPVPFASSPAPLPTNDSIPQRFEQPLSITLGKPQCASLPHLVGTDQLFRYIPIIVTGTYGSYSLTGERYKGGVRDDYRIDTQGEKADNLYIGSMPGDKNSYKISYKVTLFSSSAQKGTVLLESSGSASTTPCE